MNKKEYLSSAIAAIKILKSKPQVLSDTERAILMAFPGGGVLKECGVFLEKDKPEWLYQGKMQLLELLNMEEWTSLQNVGLQNAHYTAPGVRRVLWDVLTPHLNPGDKVLDPGCGVGGFAVEMPSFFKYTGVEKDGLSAALAKLAHPTAQIYHRDFLKWSYPEQFNLVIGNVPFVNGIESMKLDGKWLRIGLHAQFFVKAISHLTPGGLLVLLTSTNTLDSRTPDYFEFREWVHQRCEFLGAVRLPNSGTHQGATEVTTDLILLRRREQDYLGEVSDWVGVNKSHIAGCDDRPAYLSNWYLHNPEYMLGEPVNSNLRGKNGNPTTTVAVVARPNQDTLGELKKRLNLILNKETIMATVIPSDKFKSSSVFAFILRENPKKKGIEIHLPPDCETDKKNAIDFIAKILAASFQQANTNPKLYYASFSQELMRKCRGWVKVCEEQKFGAYEISPDEPVDKTPSRRRSNSASKEEKPATNKLLDAIAVLLDNKLESLTENIGVSLVNYIESERSNSQGEVEKLKTERDELATTLQQLRDEMLAFQQKYTDLEKECNQAKSQVAELTQECDCLRSELQELGFDREEKTPIFDSDEDSPVFPDDEALVFPNESDNSPIFPDEEEEGFNLDSLDTVGK